MSDKLIQFSWQTHLPLISLAKERGLDVEISSSVSCVTSGHRISFSILLTYFLSLFVFNLGRHSADWRYSSILTTVASSSR